MKKLRPLALMCCVSSAIALQCTLPAFSQTAIPRQMSYQGVLREGENIVVDGKYSIQFALYGSSEGGMPLWTEVQTVELRGGLFNVILGQFVALPTTLPTDAWLGIAINNSIEMPRTKLTSVPFALTAGTAQALTPNATGAVLSLNGQQGALELRAADGFEVRAEKGVLTIGKSTQSKEEEILNQGTEWLLAGNTNATTSHWLGTSNDVPLIVKTNNTERLRIQSTGNGNVGIGETNPGSRLTVARTFHLTNTGGAPELRLSASSGSASTTFKTGTQLTSVTYTLPSSAPSSNGQVLTSTTTGMMTWTTPAANLAHFNEGFHNAAPNAAVTVASFTPKLAVPNLDVAIAPKGTGALLADIPDGTVAGGNKRGENAVDLQMSRNAATEVASGWYSTIGGGLQNTSSGWYSTISGGQANTSSGWYSTVGGGDGNAVISGFLNSTDHSTIGGGDHNVISSEYPRAAYHSIIGGGSANIINSSSSVISGGIRNAIRAGESSVIGGGGYNEIWGESSVIGGGAYNSVESYTSVIAGGFQNEINSHLSIGSVISGGSDNVIEGRYSAIIGGRGLTLTGSGSFGFLGNNIYSSNEMTVNNDNAAVFGNVDLLLINNDGLPREIRFYASDGAYTAFKAAGNQSTTQIYTLPLTHGLEGQVLTSNGLGQLSWTSNGTGLEYFHEFRYVNPPNTLQPVHVLSVVGSEFNIDFAIGTKGDGALLRSIPDGIYTGGNKRGYRAVDLQIDRESETQVASGRASIISGGVYNTASGDYTIASGGYGNTASGNYSTVSGGYGNTASGNYSTVSGGLTNEALGFYANINGGSNNAVDMQYSTIGGGSGNIVQYGISGVSGYATIGGGRENSVSGDYSMIGGGFENTINDDFSIIAGGRENIVNGQYSAINSGELNSVSGSYSVVNGGLENTITDAISSSVLGGASNSINGSYSIISGGYRNQVSGHTSSIIGGRDNIISGNYSGILGGIGLTLSGNGSVGFLGNNNDGTRNMTVSAANTAVFGNVDMWLINNDNTAHELRLYEASGTGTNYTAFKAGAQSADIVYTLPTSAGSNGQVLTTNGSGVLSWTTASGGGLTHFTESRNTSAPNATVPVHQIAATGSETNIDIALTPKGSGALTAHRADGTTTGGVKRGQYAVDLQMSRFQATQVASGYLSTVSGGSANTASAQSSTIAGGEGNTTSGYLSTVSGGSANTASDQSSTVGGGEFNSATNLYSTVGGGAGNTASGNASVVSGGWDNTASAQSSTVGGGVNNTVIGSYSFIGGGEDNNANVDYAFVGGGARNDVVEGSYGFIGGGADNTVWGTYSVVSGGSFNTTNFPHTSVLGGQSNTAGGAYSSILGGRGLTLNGNGSVGYLGNNIDGSRNMTVDAANTAVFGNVDMWLVNNDNTAHELRLYEASGSGTNYTAFKAGAQSADIVYTLPTSAGSNGQVLTTNGSGVLSWTTVSGGGSLTHFTESRNTSVPNGSRPVHQFAATGTETHIDIALTPKGQGALAAHKADGTDAGGNKRGEFAVDWQSVRAENTQVASGMNSVIAGGERNTASGTHSSVGGGYINAALGSHSSVGGGFVNTATGLYSTIGGGNVNATLGAKATIGGGIGNTADGENSVIGGGFSNSAGGFTATVGGGYENTAGGWGSTVGGGLGNSSGGFASTINGGAENSASGNYTSVLGGRGLSLSGNGSVGFLGNNNDGTRNMTLSAANTAVFGNVDMWLVNNDNTAHEMRLYEASSSGTNYTAFKAGAQSTNIVYTLPTSAGSNGQVLTTNGSGVLSWGIVGFQYFSENRNAIVPNTSRPVHQIVVSGDENDIDLALSPKGDGALTASVANGIPSGGNKRGAGAVDWQTRRNAAEFVASGHGSVLSGGTDNTASGMNAVVSGGQGNVAAGTNSAILGGRGLTLSGSGSVGFLGKNTGGHNMNVSAANTAVFGNVDMWLINNDSISRELRFYEKSSAGNHYTGFKAQDQAASITYTLPAGDGSSGQVLTTNGTGSLYWSSAGSGGLTHFTESVNTAVPNATIPVVRLLATNGATNVDIALSPKGMGALTADLADNTVTGGNKRGAKAVDWQMQRTSAVQIANGDHSVIGGGSDNAAIGQYAVAAGGYTNNAAGYASAIGGGAGNFGNASFATVAGGSTNTASATYASVGGGDDNTASGIYSVVSGGFNNIAAGFSSSINGGNANEVHGQYSGINGGELNIINSDYSAILGGNGLTLHADRSIGYNANNEFGTRAMSVNTPNTAVFNNVDFWLTNNDNTTRSLRFYEQYNNDGAFPNSTNYIGFKAPNAIAADIVWTLPAADGTNGQVLTTNGSGQLSWASGGATLQNFTETVNTSAPNTSVPVVQFTATNASTNVDIALTPKGTGSLAAHSATGSASGGNKRGANAVDWQTLRSLASEIASGTASVIGGGGGNTASATYSTIAGGQGNVASQGYSTVGGGIANAANGAYSTVGGGVNNTVSGGSSVIPGGSGLTLSGAGSFGFLSNNAGTNAMSISQNNVAVFANTNLWLANNDANPSELRFYEANTVTSGAFPPAALNFTAFKAQPQTANIVYTLPADDGNAGQVLSTDGTGMLSWADASAGALSHFVESYHNDGNNGAVTVSRLSASTAAANVDIALSPRGVGSLLASLPDGTATGGNKRGSSAVDWQLSRNSNLQIASGNYSVISGGQYNRASSDHAAVGGGIGNNASGQVAIIAGGQNNTASSTWSTVSGGFNNSATGSSSVVVGGFGNIAAGENSTVLGGRGLNLEGSGNIGFLGNNSGGPRNMTVNTSNTAVFGNVDMWLINNDNTAHELRIYEASGNGDNYTAFKAQAQTETIVYTLPATAPPATDYVMTVQESSGNNATLGWGKRIIQVQDTPVDCDNLTGGGGNATVDITVADAVVGGTVHVSPRQAMEGGVFIAYSFIPSNGTVRIMFINATAGDIDPDSVNMDITVIQP